MDAWTAWFVVNTAVLLLPGVAALVPGLLLAAIGLRRRGGCVLWASLPLLLVGGVLIYAVASRTEEMLNRVQLAQRLGSAPPQGLFSYQDPSTSLRARLTAGLSTREQVHQVMRVAKARYDCPEFNAEKYLLYINHYQIQWGSVPDGIIVYYRSDGVVSRVVPFGDSLDPILPDRCSATPVPPDAN